MASIEGFFVGPEDLRRIYRANHEELRKYTREQIEAGIIELRFLGVLPEYVVQKESVFYPYLQREGRSAMVVIL